MPVRHPESHRFLSAEEAEALARGEEVPAYRGVAPKTKGKKSQVKAKTRPNGHAKLPPVKVAQASKSFGKNTRPVTRTATAPSPHVPLSPSPSAAAPSMQPMMPSMPQAGTQQTPPILSLHGIGRGVYLLRLFNVAYNGVGIAAVKALPDAMDLIVITPTDTKTFKIGTPQPTPAQVRTAAPRGAKHALPPGTDPETAQLIEEADREAEASGTEEEEEVDQEGFAPEPMDEVMRLAAEADRQSTRGRQPTPGGSACGRCQGTGEIHTMLDGGGHVKGTCPVCQGRGTIRRYGATPQRRGR